MPYNDKFASRLYNTLVNDDYAEEVTGKDATEFAEKIKDKEFSDRLYNTLINDDYDTNDIGKDNNDFYNMHTDVSGSVADALKQQPTLATVNKSHEPSTSETVAHEVEGMGKQIEGAVDEVASYVQKAYSPHQSTQKVKQQVMATQYPLRPIYESNKLKGYVYLDKEKSDADTLYYYTEDQYDKKTGTFVGEAKQAPRSSQSAYIQRADALKPKLTQMLQEGTMTNQQIMDALDVDIKAQGSQGGKDTDNRYVRNILESYLNEMHTSQVYDTVIKGMVEETAKETGAWYEELVDREAQEKINHQAGGIGFKSYQITNPGAKDPELEKGTNSRYRHRLNAGNPQDMLKQMRQSIALKLSMGKYADQIDQLAKKAGLSRKEYMDKYVNLIAEEAVNGAYNQYMVDSYMPKNFIQYSMLGLQKETILGMATSAVHGDDDRNLFTTQASEATESYQTDERGEPIKDKEGEYISQNPYYTPGDVAKLSKFGLTFLADTPAFMLGEGLAGKAAQGMLKAEAKSLAQRVLTTDVAQRILVREGEEAAKKYALQTAMKVLGTNIGKSMPKIVWDKAKAAMLSGGINFSTYDLTRELTSELTGQWEYNPETQTYEKKSLSWQDLAMSAVSGAVKGAALPLPGMGMKALFSDKKLWSRVCGNIAGFLGESLGFAGTSLVEQYIHQGMKDWDPTKTWEESVMQLLVMKGTGVMKNPKKAWKGLIGGADGQALIPDSTIERLNRSKTGAQMLKAIEALQNGSAAPESLEVRTEIGKMLDKLSKNPDGEEIYYDDVAKLSLLFGILPPEKMQPVGYERINDTDIATVDMYGRRNNPITFKNAAEANKWITANEGYLQASIAREMWGSAESKEGQLRRLSFNEAISRAYEEQLEEEGGIQDWGDFQRNVFDAIEGNATGDKAYDILQRVRMAQNKVMEERMAEASKQKEDIDKTIGIENTEENAEGTQGTPVTEAVPGQEDVQENTEGTTENTEGTRSDKYKGEGIRIVEEADTEAANAAHIGMMTATARVEGIIKSDSKASAVKAFVERKVAENPDACYQAVKSSPDLTAEQKEALNKYIDAMTVHESIKRQAMYNANVTTLVHQNAVQGMSEGGNISLISYKDKDGNQRVAYTKPSSEGASIVRAQEITPDGYVGEEITLQAEQITGRQNMSASEYESNVLASKVSETEAIWNDRLEGIDLTEGAIANINIADTSKQMLIARVEGDTVTLQDPETGATMNVSQDKLRTYVRNHNQSIVDSTLMAERAEAEQARQQAEQEAKTKRYNTGIVGYEQGTPDITHKDTKPAVAAEMLIEQSEGDRKKAQESVQMQKEELQSQLKEIERRQMQLSDEIEMTTDEAELKMLIQQKAEADKQYEDISQKISKLNHIGHDVMDEQTLSKFKSERRKVVEKATAKASQEIVAEQREQEKAGQSIDGIRRDESGTARNADGTMRVGLEETRKAETWMLNTFAEYEDARTFLEEHLEETRRRWKQLQKNLNTHQSRIGDYENGYTDISEASLEQMTKSYLQNEQEARRLAQEGKQLQKLLDRLDKTYADRIEDTYADTPSGQRMAQINTRKSATARLNEAKKVYAENQQAADVLEDLEPQDIDEYVSQIGNGVIAWEDFERDGYTVRGLQTELGNGWTRSTPGKKGDTFAFDYMLARKGEGKGIDEIVHDLWEHQPEGRNWSDLEIKEALLRNLMGAQRPSDLKEKIITNRIAEAERIMSEDERRMAEAEARGEDLKAETEEGAPIDVGPDPFTNEDVLNDVGLYGIEGEDTSHNGKESGVIDKPSNLSEEETAELDAFAQSIGARFEILTTEEAEKKYPKQMADAPMVDDGNGNMVRDWNGLTIPGQKIIVLNAEKNPTGTAARKYFGHEITHAIKKVAEVNPWMWDMYVESVKASMGKAYDEAFVVTERAYRNVYLPREIARLGKEKWEDLTEAEQKTALKRFHDKIEEEVCADWAGENLFTDKGEAKKLLEEARKRGESSTSIAKRMVDRLQNVINKFINLFKNSRTEAGRNIMGNAILDELNKAKQNWMELYKYAEALEREGATPEQIKAHAEAVFSVDKNTQRLSPKEKLRRTYPGRTEEWYDRQIEYDNRRPSLVPAGEGASRYQYPVFDSMEELYDTAMTGKKVLTEDNIAQALWYHGTTVIPSEYSHKVTIVHRGYDIDQYGRAKTSETRLYAAEKMPYLDTLEENYTQMLDACADEGARAILEERIDDVKKSREYYTKMINEQGETTRMYLDLDAPRFSLDLWHGSGADFDKLDHAFIGTGEGNMSNGYGTYLASVKDKADLYANISAKKRGENEQTEPRSMTRHLYQVTVPSDNGRNYIAWSERMPQEQVKELTRTLYGEIVNNDTEEMYTTRQAKDELWKELQSLSSDIDGKDLYGTIASYLGGQKEASRFLSKNGYTGIRVKGEYANENENFVIFDEKDMAIKRHYRYPVEEEHPEDMQSTSGYDEGDNARFSIVKDKSEIDRLEKEDVIHAYRSMAVVEVDGKRYLVPPMASVGEDGMYRDMIPLDDDMRIIPTWVVSDENPDNVPTKGAHKGQFHLVKDNGNDLWAAYNPYNHLASNPLNDQFGEAQSRPNVVTVLCAVPKSEADADPQTAYHAEKAKDPVGRRPWKAGIIQGELTGTRELILSRWCKPVEIVPDREVAEGIYKMIDGKVETMPTNILTPSVRAELEAMGVDFVKTTNSGILAEGEHEGDYYSWWYGKNAEKNRIKKFREWARAEGIGLEEWMKANGREGQISGKALEKAEAQHQKMLEKDRQANIVLPKNTSSKDGRSAVSVTENGDVRFSFATRESEGELLNALYQSVAGKRNRQEIEEMRKTGDAMMQGVVGLMAKHPAFADWNERLAIVDKNGNPVYSVFINNSDTEAPTIELSRNCVKKEAMNSLLSVLRQEGMLSKLNNLRYLDLREILKKHGYSIACEMCYVEARRENVETKRRLADDWNSIVKQAGLSNKYFMDQSEDMPLTPHQEKVLKDIVQKNGNKRPSQIARLMLDNPGLRGRFNYEALYTPEGWNELLMRFDDQHRFLKFLASHDGANTAKPTFGTQPFSQRKFLQQYADLSRYFGENGIRVGGFRKHSFSDADPLTFVDDYQIHENMALTDSGMFGYTKVPYYVDMWGETGEFINQSLVVDIDTTHPDARRYAGLIKIGDPRHQKALGMTDAEYEAYKIENNLKDGDWDYYFANESFPVKQAMDFRKDDRFGGRVGNVLCAPSDECILRALDDERIDVIIGWHSSNKLVNSKERTGYDHATDYGGTKGLNETAGNKDTKTSNVYLPKMGVIAPTMLKGIMGKEHVEFNYNEACQQFGDARTAANAYLEWCDLNGFTPMYAKFREHPNYYKLLNDFRRYDNNGKPLIQGAIDMNLPENWAEKLDSYLTEREVEYSKNTEGIATDEALLNDVYKAMFSVDKKQKEIWKLALQSLDQPRHAEAPGRDNEPKSLSGANLAILDGIEASLDATLAEINKRPMSRNDFLNVLSGSFGIRNNERDKSKYRNRIILGDGEEYSIRFANHPAHAVNFIIYKANSDTNYGVVINGAPEEFLDGKRPRFREYNGVNYLELDYFTQRFDDVSDEERQNLQAEIVTGLKTLIKTGKLDDMPVPSKVNASGIYKPIMDNFRKQNPEAMFSIDTENFKNWFGDWEKDPKNASKVVDEEGMPLMVYHGTPEAGFHDFIDDNGAIWATTTMDHAKVYSWNSGKKGEGYVDGIYPLYLNIKNPLNVGYIDTSLGESAEYADLCDKLNVDAYDIAEKCLPDTWKEALGDAEAEGLTGEEAKESALMDIPYYELTRSKAFADLVKSKGYDGLKAKETINDGTYRTTDTYAIFDATQAKSAIANNGDYDGSNPDIRFSLNIQSTDPFYSNAAKAVEGIRQEKATPEQWLKMIEKAGGLKKGEDKWMGLSEWLKQKTAEGVISGKKSITKQEVMDYISNNAIKLEDVNYIDSENMRREGLARMREEFEQTKKAIQEEGNGMSVEEAQKAWDEFSNEMYDKYGGAFMLHLTDEEKKRNDELKEATKHAKREYESWELADEAFSRMIGKYGSDFDDGFYVQGGKLYLNADDRTDTVRDSALRVMGYDNIKPINDTRMTYTTAGLKDNKEIALTVPTIEPYNEKDGIHFGDAGEGRAVAWIRFGDAESVSKTDGHRSRVLVIDEIQSKRHQDGREEGYDTDYKESPKYKYDHARLEMSNYRADMVAKYGEYFMKEDMTPEEQKKYQELYDAMEEASNYNSESVPLYNVPDAPFRKNWHELAMKRMLRYAAENGYDKVAWTTGEQQAERYNIGGVVPYININTDLHPAVDERASWKTLRFEANGSACRVDINTDGKVILAEGIGNDAEGKSVNEVFGKEVGDQIMQSQADDRIILEGKHIGGEGMKGFYGQILPKFMQKYGKKWGAKVGEVELNLPNEADRKMWSVDVTPEMKESVMEGQAMFSVPKKYNEKKELLKERYKDTSTEDLFVSLHKNGETDYDKVTEITRRVKEEGVRLYRQGKEASGRGNTELGIAGQIICRGAQSLSQRDIWRKDATTRLIEWAEDNGYFNEDPRHFLKDYEEEPFAQATESKVYSSNDGKTVRKIWSYAELFKYGEKPTTIDEAIDNVMWSNQVFPNDQTKLVGMTYNEYGDAAFIVEQDFAGKPLSKIIKSYEERQGEIDKIMLSMFEAVRVDKNDDVFDAEDFRFEDAHGDNITRDDEGYYRFIDIKVVPKFEGPDIELKDNPDNTAMFSLNKPVRRRGETDVEYMKRLSFWDARKQEGERMLNAQKVVEDQIKHLMDNKLIGATQKSQLSSMLSSLRNATDSNLYDQIKKVERTVREVEANVLSKEIADALSLKIQDLNGRNMKIAKNVDNQTRQVIGNVKDRMKGLAETDEDKNIKKIGSDLWHLRDENRRLQAEVDSARSKGFPYEVDSVEYNNAIAKIQENEASIAQMSQQVKDLKAARDKEVRAQIEWGGRDVQTQLDELMQKMDEAVDPDSPEKWTEEDQVKWVTLDVLKDRVELEKLYQDLYDAREKRSNATTTAERRAWDLQCENIELERQQKLRAFNEKIKTLVEGGKESLAAQKQAEIQHRLDLIRGMMSDIRGERGNKMPSEPSEAQDRSKRKGFKGFMEGAFTSTLKSFEYMAHVIDRNHFSRDGWFFKYFMKSKNGVMAAQNNYLKNYEQSMQTLTDATEKIFGKKATDVAEEGTKDYTYEEHGITMFIEDEMGNVSRVPLHSIHGMEPIKMSKNRAAYIYMVSKMPDGMAKLMNMGFDETSIIEIKNFIGPEYVEWADYVQSKFLPELFPRYNKTYTEIYGTPMSDIDNYVPLRIDPTQTRIESDLQDNKTQGNRKQMQQKNSFQINRTVNLLPIDLTTDCFQVIQKHIADAEDFDAFARVRRDMDDLYSSNAVINQLNANSTEQARDLIEASKLAVHSEQPENVKSLEKAFMKATKGIIGGNIAYRIGTALKQTLSAPVFFAYTYDPRFTKIMAWSLIKNFVGNAPGVVAGTVGSFIPGVHAKDGLVTRIDKGKMSGFIEDFKWAMDNIPSFKSRVSKGDMGNDIMDTDMGVFDRYLSAGMTANQLIDAVTCVSGIKAIYKYEMMRMEDKVKTGVMTEEEAHNMACMEADIFYNGTQQSSHRSFLSPVQTSRHAFEKAITAYQNASIGFARKMMEEVHNTGKLASRDKMLRTYTRTFETMGVDRDEALAMAKKRYWHQIGITAVRAGMFGFLANWLWDFGGRGLFGFYRSDEQKEESFALKNIPSYISRGTYGTNALNGIIQFCMKSPFLFYEEMEDAVDTSKNLYDKYGLSPQLAEYALIKALRIPGVDLEVMSNIYLGMESMAGMGATPEERMLAMEFLINLAKGNRKSTSKQIYKDMPIDEQALIVLRAGKVFDENDWRKYLPGASTIPQEKYDEVMKELAKIRVADADQSNSPISEDEMDKLLKKANDIETLNEMYNSTDNEEYRQKIEKKAKQLHQDEAFNKMTWGQRYDNYNKRNQPKPSKPYSVKEANKKLDRVTTLDDKISESDMQKAWSSLEKDFDLIISKQGERTPDEEAIVTKHNRLIGIYEQYRKIKNTLVAPNADPVKVASKLREIRKKFVAEYNK